MDERRFDRMIKTFGSGVSRRWALRGLVAGVGGALFHLAEDESAARLSRCCRRLKREVAKPNCINKGGENCKVVNFTCEKTGKGICDGGWGCHDSTQENPDCQ